MTDGIRASDRRQELIEVISNVRSRWRMKMALRGAVIVVVGMLLARFVAAGILEALKFTGPAIITFRILALIAFGGLVYYGVVLPMKRRVSDNQVALYLEERDQSLQSAIMSAVETASALDVDHP